MLSNLIIMHGLIYAGGFALIILISVLINPRIWMQDFPEELKGSIPPKSNKEVKQTFVTGFLFALFIIGFPLYSISVLVTGTAFAANFLSLFIHAFSVMMICNTIYWIVFDIIIFNLIISRIRTVPGIKKMFKFSGWRRQVFGILVGSLMCGIISSFITWAALLFI